MTSSTSFGVGIVRDVRQHFNMARLTASELQDARRRSGRLGGRPAKPTVGEARATGLERLVPKAIQVLEEHLVSGRPDAWRSAHRILEHHWGKPPEYIAPTALDNAEIDGLNLDEMSTADLATLVKERRAKLASGERPTPPVDVAALTPVASDG
jgi:hypothetical protein